METQVAKLSGAYTLFKRGFLFYKKHLKQFVFIGFIAFLFSAAVGLLQYAFLSVKDNESSGPGLVALVVMLLFVMHEFIGQHGISSLAVG